MKNPSIFSHPHRRLNILTGEEILVSPHRTKRPWQGQTETASVPGLPAYDPGCYLCPGNPRATGEPNPKYHGTFVFTNDFSALVPDTPEGEYSDGPLFTARSERGICRVVCFSPRHDLTISRMSRPELTTVVETLTDEYVSLSAIDFISYVQIFENRGEAMGCSNPHPHCQIWADERIPTLPAVETARQREYRERHRGACLLCDYLAAEEERGERIVCANDSFTALVPFWAVWPFETMIIPRFHAPDISHCSPAQRHDLGEILKRMTTRFDNLFRTDFPYSMGFHQAPCDGRPTEEWHFHIHFYPPLLRSAAVRKFMVGYEMLAMPQRDITPEQSALRLRELPEVHYRDSAGSSAAAEPAGSGDGGKL